MNKELITVPFYVYAVKCSSIEMIKDLCYTLVDKFPYINYKYIKLIEVCTLLYIVW